MHLKSKKKKSKSDFCHISVTRNVFKLNEKSSLKEKKIPLIMDSFNCSIQFVLNNLNGINKNKTKIFDLKYK